VQDLIVVVVVVGFFGICLAFVGGCSRILGATDVEAEAPEVTTDGTDPRDGEPVAA
jgi:hypothetical protein